MKALRIQSANHGGEGCASGRDHGLRADEYKYNYIAINYSGKQV